MGSGEGDAKTISPRERFILANDKIAMVVSTKRRYARMYRESPHIAHVRRRRIIWASAIPDIRMSIQKLNIRSPHVI